MNDVEIGKPYLVNDGDRFWLGTLVSVDGPYSVTIEDFCWIADSGRLGAFLRQGNPSEAEAAPDGMKMHILSVRGLIKWPHKLVRRDI